VTIPYSTNLFYESIPFEMLRTYERNPQVLVSVDNLPAVCHNLTCDMNYIEPEGNITSFTYTTSTKKLVITGVGIPSDVTNITSVEFAQSLCTIDTTTLSSTNLECTLVQNPVCGTHKPILLSSLGLIPNLAAVAGLQIDCTITSVTPSSGLNLLGGDNITISGTNLPIVLWRSIVEIKFSDTQETTCVAQDSTTTTLVCLTSAFDKTASAGSTLSTTIVINGLTVSNSLSLTMASTVKATTQMSPSSVSPVLKTRVTVTLESDFPHTLTRADLSMNVSAVNDTSYIRYLNVISVDDATKSFVAMFGGAYSGQFNVHIRHSAYGLVETAGLVLDVSGNITSYTPTSGSIYGGTLLTITGTNFGNATTDNPV